MPPLFRSTIPALAIPALLLLSGCAEGPFVATKYDNIIPQPTATGRVRTNFDVCYAEGAEREKIMELARQTCADFRLQPEVQGEARWQCKVSAPHVVRFACVDPSQPPPARVVPALPPR